MLFFLFGDVTSYGMVQTLKNAANTFNIGIASVSSVFCDSYQLKVLGSQDISDDNKVLIRNILAQLGIKQYEHIHIKQMSPALINVLGNANALATANAIFIDEDFFNSLTKDERVALIGHEGIHIKNKDVLKTLLAVCLAKGIFFSTYALSSKFIKSSFKRMCLDSGVVLSLFLGLTKIARYQEESADKESATILNCHKGTQQLVQKFFMHPEEPKEESAFSRARDWIGRKFAKHPFPKERIAYLSK